MSTSNYRTVLRHILMLSLIPEEPKFVSTDTLWQRLNEQGYPVALRTVQRDLKEYKNASFVQIRSKKIEGIQDLCWYYRKDTEIRFVQKMTYQSALMFNLVEKFLKTRLPIAIQKDLEKNFSRASNVLKQLSSGSFEKWPKKIRILSRGQHLLPAKIKGETSEVVFQSLWEEKQFEATYRKRGETEVVERIINPLGLVFQEEVAYLVCTFWKYDQKKDIKHIALHRIETASHLETDRIAPKNFDLYDYVKEGHFSYIEKEQPIKLKILLDEGAAIHLYESKLSEDQKLTEQENGQVILEATVKDTSELRWWLLSFGEYIEVLDPEDIREEFSRIARNMASKYIE